MRNKCKKTNCMECNNSIKFNTFNNINRNNKDSNKIIKFIYDINANQIVIDDFNSFFNEYISKSKTNVSKIIFKKGSDYSLNGKDEINGIKINNITIELNGEIIVEGENSIIYYNVQNYKGLFLCNSLEKKNNIDSSPIIRNLILNETEQAMNTLYTSSNNYGGFLVQYNSRFFKLDNCKNIIKIEGNNLIKV